MRISPISPCRDLVAVVVDELHLAALDRRPDRAGLALAVGMVERGDRRRLAEAVALEHLAAEALLEAAQDLDRQRGAAGGADAQLGHVAALAVGMVQQGAVHRRHALEDGAAVALEDLQRLARVEARQQRDAGTAADRGVHRARLAEGVKQRQAAEDDVADAHVEQADGDRHVAAQVVVRELGALRLAGRARRVEDHRGVVAVDLGDVLVGLVGEDQALDLARLDLDDLDVAGLLRPGLGGLHEAVPGEQQLGLRIGQVVGDLAALEQHVHRHDDGARAQHAVVDGREVRDVGQHDPDAVAGADALALEHRRDALAGVLEQAVVETRRRRA